VEDDVVAPGHRTGGVDDRALSGASFSQRLQPASTVMTATTAKPLCMPAISHRA